MTESIQFKICHYGDKEKRFVIVKCKDLAKFGDVMNFAADQWDVNNDTCALLTKDGYGINVEQSAGNVFLKYGEIFDLHPHVNKQMISWHARN